MHLKYCSPFDGVRIKSLQNLKDKNLQKSEICYLGYCQGYHDASITQKHTFVLYCRLIINLNTDFLCF